MEKIWLKHYPKGVPAEIDINEYKSVRDVFEESATKFATRPAFTCMGKSLTFADLDRLSVAFGVYLQANGCKKGTRVALMMPNILQYPVCLFGTIRAGCTVVNVNPLYTARELEHQLADSGAEVIVVVENFARTVAEVLGRTKVRRVIVTSIGELLGFKGIVVDLVLRRVKKMIPAWSIPEAVRLADALAAGRTGKLERPALAHDDIAFLQYTGGTTGVAKGAVLLHRNIVANLLQARAWLRPFLSSEREIVITPLPLYHIFSLTANCLTFMTLGGENILIPNPRDIPGFVKEMGNYKFTAFTGVNTLFNALINNPEFGKLDFSSLRMTLGGGLAVQEAVAVKWKEVTGSPLIEAYGLTETSPAATINPLSRCCIECSLRAVSAYVFNREPPHRWRAIIVEFPAAAPILCRARSRLHVSRAKRRTCSPAVSRQVMPRVRPIITMPKSERGDLRPVSKELVHPCRIRSAASTRAKSWTPAAPPRWKSTCASKAAPSGARPSPAAHRPASTRPWNFATATRPAITARAP